MTFPETSTFIIIVTTIGLCHLSFLTPGVLGQRASYGEACNRTIRCDSKASLSCEDGICQCLLPEKMVFDPALSKCLTMAGERCVYTAVEMTETASSSAEIEKKKWSEQLKCVTNSVCSSEGYCACDSNFFENYNGTCEQKHGFGESCSMNSHCDETAHLICNGNATCDCNDLTVFHQGWNECVGRVGSLCKDFSKCTLNAACPPKRQGERYYNYNQGKYLHRVIEYSTETCSCNEGHQVSAEGVCLATYGFACDFHDYTKRCIPELMCHQGSCQCPYGNQQYFDTDTNSCVSLVGGTCSTWDNSKCVTNSECVSKNGTDWGSCRCREGFIEADRRCELAFGEKCGSSISGNTKCDTISPLYCIEGYCKCYSLQYYDHEARMCRGLEGSSCSTQKDKEDFCTNGAMCESFRNKTAGVGQCVCKEKFSSTAERQCQKIEAPVEPITQKEDFWNLFNLEENAVNDEMDSSTFTENEGIENLLEI